MRKTVCLLLCAALCLGLCGCIGDEMPGVESQPAGEAAAPSGDALRPYKFCLSFPSTSGFYSVLDNTVKTVVADQGDRAIPLDCGGNQAIQNELIEDMLTEGIDVMILAPVDAAGVAPALEALRKAGVPVINVGLQVEDTGLVDYTVMSDTAEAGALCAADALERQPGGGRVIVLEDAANPLDAAAVAAWDSRMTGEEWEQVGRWDCGGSIDRAREVMAGYLAENPGAVDVIFAGTDAVACGAVAALQDAKVRQGNVLVYGVGGTPEAKQLIGGGWMTATASQSPSAIGARATEIAYQLMDDTLPPKENSIDVTLITPENIGEQSLDTWN